MPRESIILKAKKSSLILLVFCVTIIYPPIRAADTIDKARYIPIDEISDDMDAYCLTVYEGTTVEKFPLKVLSVIKNHQPNRDMILVIGTDERFLRTGAVRGCSGSPVYIDGRLAGALAMSFNNATEPLYLATPIEYMLKVGTAETSVDGSGLTLVKPDFSKPLDFRHFDGQLSKVSARSAQSRSNSLLPLLTSLPPEV